MVLPSRAAIVCPALVAENGIGQVAAVVPSVLCHSCIHLRKNSEDEEE